jgi:hypothetical protein
MEEPNGGPDGGAKRGAGRRSQTGGHTGPNRGPNGAKRGGGQKDYLLLKEKRHVLYMCHVNHRQYPTCLMPGGCKKYLR